MSGLIDMWTEKLAKLREKVGHESVFTNEASKPNGSVEASGNGRQMMMISSLGLGGKLKMPTAASFNCNYSEASVSMLVDCFSA